ncbi:hypothetical protein TURU_073521 [Turdus rufiventris]|nr:hypothetical protein TURU_073521 [Turdus rufiventris]
MEKIRKKVEASARDITKTMVEAKDLVMRDPALRLTLPSHSPRSELCDLHREINDLKVEHVAENIWTMQDS